MPEQENTETKGKNLYIEPNEIAAATNRLHSTLNRTGNKVQVPLQSQKAI